MIRTAHRTYSTEPGAKSDPKTSEFTRTPSNRWRSSLRSTAKDKNGTATKASFRNLTGKENFVEMDRSSAETKTTKNDKSLAKKSEKKEELAEKAKRKFIENLSKFQRESSNPDAAKPSPFQRSYRKDGKGDNNVAGRYRQSCRAPPVAKVDTFNTGFRRSLRKTSSNENQDKKVQPISNRAKLTSRSSERTIKSKPNDVRDDESDRSSTAGSAKGAGSLSSRPSSTSSNVSDSRTPSSGGKKLTRAELAMERHMERMRKAASPTATGTPGATGGSHGNQPVTRTKSRQLIDCDVSSNSGSTKVQAKKEIFQEEKTPSLSKIDEGLKLLSVVDDIFSDFNWGQLEDLNKPNKQPLVRKSSKPSEHRRTNPKPSEDSYPKSPPSYASVKIIEDNVFTNDTGTFRDKAEIIDDSQSPAPKPRDLQRSGEHASRDDDVDINCSVEEAINTFRTLSEEIDTLKTKEFGKKKKASKKSEAKSGPVQHHPKQPEKNKEIHQTTNKTKTPKVDKGRAPIPVQMSSVKVQKSAQISDKIVNKKSPKAHKADEALARAKLEAENSINRFFESEEKTVSEKKVESFLSELEKPPQKNLASGDYSQIELKTSEHKPEKFNKEIFSDLEPEKITIKTDKFVKTKADKQIKPSDNHQPQQNHKNTRKTSVSKQISPPASKPKDQVTPEVSKSEPKVVYRGNLDSASTDSHNSSSARPQAGSTALIGSTSRSGVGAQEQRGAVTSRERRDEKGERATTNAGVRDRSDFSAATEPVVVDRSELSEANFGLSEKNRTISSENSHFVDSVPVVLNSTPGFGEYNQAASKEAWPAVTNTSSSQHQPVHEATEAQEKVEAGLGTPQSPFSASVPPESGAMSVQAKARFSQLPAAERRERLRKALMRYDAAMDSSSDESVFSDASSSDEDGDISWLDNNDTDTSSSSYGSRNKLKTISEAKPRHNGGQHTRDVKVTQESRGPKVTQEARGPKVTEPRGPKVTDEPRDSPDAGKLKAIWEVKIEERKTPVTSQTRKDLSSVSVNDVKSSFERPSTPPAPQTPEEPGVGEGEGSRNVGSMLSMWESKKASKKSAFDASTDEAFDTNTMGRLQGAKALFHSMAKQSPAQSPKRTTTTSSSTASPKQSVTSSPKQSVTSSPKQSVTSSASSYASLSPKEETPPSPKYDVIETTTSPKSSPVAKQPPKAVVTSRLRKQTESDVSDYEDEEGLSDADTLSSTSSSDDDTSTSDVSNVRSMWERQSIKKSSPSSNGESPSGHPNGDVTPYTSEPEDSVVYQMDSEGVDPPRNESKVAPRSNIQRRIIAKKKFRERRSMTQPITGDDVTAAKQLVREQRSAEEDSKSGEEQEESGSNEEEQLTFAQRLYFFNKICAKQTSPPKKRFAKRSSQKRFQTQPVDAEVLLEARRNYTGGNTEQDSVPPPCVDIPVSRDRVRRISEEIESKFGDSPNEQRVSVTSQENSESEIVGVGRLRSKFLEQGSGDVSKPTKDQLFPANRRDRPPSPISPRNRSPSPINLRGRSPSPSSLKDRSLSPLSSVRSTSPDPQTEDMGKIREAEIKSTGSIRDRMKLLQKNQDEDWKKRVRKDGGAIQSSLGERMNKLQGSEENWKQKKDVVTNGRSSSLGGTNIHDRLNSILTNSEGWKSKAGKQNDASQFTVQAKIAKRTNPNVTPILPSPSMTRKVLPTSHVDQPVVTIDDVTSRGPSLNKLSDVLKLAKKGLEPDVIKMTEETTTEVPDFVDEDFENFFSGTTIEVEVVTLNGTAGSEDGETEEPEWLIEESTTTKLSELGHLKRNINRGSRNRGSTRNPLKALAARSDIKQTYTEVRSNVTKLEQQRLASRFGHGSNFTSAALAGLAHKADFKKVSLRSTKTTSAFSAGDFKPWKNKMLLRVKGRRRVQTRLVEPCVTSLNGGDAFLLILPDKMFAWFGEYSNVIERAKVQEIADYVIHQGDLGCKATSVNVIEELASDGSSAREFWQHIGGRGEIAPSGGDREDEAYESNAEASIKTYTMSDSKLVPLKEAWGKLPAMGMLETSGTFVFDFGAEMYVWQGKAVSFDDRQLGVQLARALWDQGYDYSEVGFCPFVPLGEGTSNLKGERPEWAMFARVNENLETALVQEKFEDWSNIHREVGERDQGLRETSRGQVAAEMLKKQSIQPEMQKCEVSRMLEDKSTPAPVNLQGFNLWRGYGDLFDEDGRGMKVITGSVCCWRASDKSVDQISDKEWGVFHRCETYVIRWRYVISSTGKWSDEGKATSDTRKDVIGRERSAYFLWAGRESTLSEKGAAALMAAEIDKEVGTQVTVFEFREPPSMKQCLKGAMIVVDGKAGERSGFYSWKLFAVRGTTEEETSLHQVPCESQSLRSRSCFVVLNARQSKVVVWSGCRAGENATKLALLAADKIQSSKMTCLGFRASCKNVEVAECREGNESEDFIEAMLRIRRNKYVTMLDREDCPPTFPPCRGWHLAPSGDQFVAKELPPVVHPLCDDVIEHHPIVHEQLSELDRPALALFDTLDGVYLWLSSVPEDLKGSAKRQLDICKRLAMETVIDYCKEHRPECEPTLVQENHEPLPFTNSFPVWNSPQKAPSYEEKRAKKPRPVSEVLQTVTRLTYTIDELRASPLPEGIDPNHLETYLSIKDFEELFEITKEEFYASPPWKQQKLRKEKNLF